MSTSETRRQLTTGVMLLTADALHVHVEPIECSVERENESMWKMFS